MKNKIQTFLQLLDLYDYLKIFKDRYFKSETEKFVDSKRVSFYTNIISNGDLCFDVGANYGNRSSVFLKLGAKVVAFEPQPRPLKFLKRKFGNKIVVVNKALGSKPGRSDLYISSASTLTSMSQEWINQVSKKRFEHASWEKKIEIQVSTLDEMIKKYGIPSFCKIDVEGFELEVLKGLTQPIKSISFEFTIPEFVDRAVECIKYLSDLGTIVCNYSVGETMEFALNEWMNPESFIPLVKDLSNQGVVDGDIYIQFNKL